MTTIKIQDSIYKDLLNRYEKSSIDKRELAKELSVSVSSINTCIVNCSGIPEYRKVGSSKNARVIFPIINVAEYLSNTIKVA